MKSGIFIIVLIGLFSLFFCESCASAKENLNPDSDLLLNCWRHAYEEETGPEEKVYRPCDYTNFPPSRYRATYEFLAEGACRYSVLAPNDAHYMESGSWVYLEEEGQVQLFNSSNELVETLDVLGLKADRLTIRR